MQINISFDSWEELCSFLATASATPMITSENVQEVAAKALSKAKETKKKEYEAPAIEKVEEPKKEEPKETVQEEAEEPAKEEAPSVSEADVKKLFTKKLKEGKKAEVQKLFEAHGVAKLSELLAKETDYAAVYAEAEVL